MIKLILSTFMKKLKIGACLEQTRGRKRFLQSLLSFTKRKKSCTIYNNLKLQNFTKETAWKRKRLNKIK